MRKRMSEIGAGDVCEVCGKVVRAVHVNADDLGGPKAPILNWNCGCDTIDGPTVTA